jgi:hypothetical protein
VKVIRTKTPSFGKWFQKATGNKEAVPYGSLQIQKQDNLLKKVMFWIRLNLIIPDARVIWNKACDRAASQEILTDKYDCVITTGPPQSTHLVGLSLKRKYRIHWFCDFRDPWTQIYYLSLANQNKLIKKLNARLEKAVVQSADLNFVISQYIADSLPPGRKEVFWNGFDPEDFAGTEYQPGAHFRIKYIGKFTEGQDITSFLQILSGWQEQKAVEALQMHYIGTFAEFPAALQNTRIDFVNIPYLPHQQALQEMVDAELLLLLINDYEGNEGMLTTKLFEYIGSRTPILCVGPEQGEAAQIIKQFSAGTVCPYHNRERIEEALDFYYLQWTGGNNVRNEANINSLSAPEQAAQLAKRLEKLTEKL